MVALSESPGEGVAHLMRPALGSVVEGHDSHDLFLTVWTGWDAAEGSLETPWVPTWRRWPEQDLGERKELACGKGGNSNGKLVKSVWWDVRSTELLAVVRK